MSVHRCFLAVAAGVTSLVSSEKEDVIIHSGDIAVYVEIVARRRRLWSRSRPSDIHGRHASTRRIISCRLATDSPLLRSAATEGAVVPSSEPSHRLDVTRATDSHTRALSTTSSSHVAWPAGSRAVPRRTQQVARHEEKDPGRRFRASRLRNCVVVLPCHKPRRENSRVVSLSLSQMALVATGGKMADDSGAARRDLELGSRTFARVDPK